MAMTGTEKRAVNSLAGIFMLRMLGLFLILPVFALYAQGLKGQTPFLIGLALGAYGLSQALLQIPFGMMSDRLGRKRVITAGLILFAIGSVIAATSDSIHGVIIGRAVQGSGAIAAAVMALTADLTREEYRTRAMATIGVSIGMSFSIALVLGPILDRAIGMQGIFWLTAVLAIMAIGILYLFVPNPVSIRHHSDAEVTPTRFGEVLKNTRLLGLDFGIFVLHLTLMAMFVAVPLALAEKAGLPRDQHWKVYLGVVVTGFISMIPLMIMSHKPKLFRYAFSGGIALLILAQAVLYLEGDALVWIVIGLWIFFTGFNLLEATLPSVISRIAPVDNKGTAIGVYNTFQFFGAFVGGALGGWLVGRFGLTSVFLMSAALLGAWLVVAWMSPTPEFLQSHLLRVSVDNEQEARALAGKLMNIPGVAEAVVVLDDGVAYLKVDKKVFDESRLQEFSPENP